MPSLQLIRLEDSCVKYFVKGHLIVKHHYITCKTKRQFFIRLKRVNEGLHDTLSKFLKA